MPGTLWRVLSIGLSFFLIAGCSPSADKTGLSDAASLSLTFDWQAPARLNVRETTIVKGRDVKIRYDLMVEKFDQLDGHMLVSFANVTPIRLDGRQINMSTYPTKNRQQVKELLLDFYSRPSFIVTPEGRIAAFTDVDKSIRARIDISQPDGVEAEQGTYEEAIEDQSLVALMHSNSDAVWSCLVRPWLDFSTPTGEHSEQAVSLVIFEGAEPAPATRTNTNFGFVKNSESLLELESVTISSGVELARVLQKLTQRMTGLSGELPKIEGVASATNRRSSKVRLDPASLKPQWARCDNELTIDSKDDSVLPSASRTITTEFDVQWL